MNTKTVAEDQNRSLSPKNIVLMLVSFPLAWFFVRYLRLPLNATLLLPTAFLLFAAQNRGLGCFRLQQKKLPYFVAFSILLSICLIFSQHINLDYTDVVASTSENAFTPFSPLDLLAFFVLTYLLSLILVYLFSFPGLLSRHRNRASVQLQTGIAPSQVKWLLLLTALFFIAWLPYFLVYYPGLIYGDSLNSITQAIHAAPYTNHFPLLYTFFIELCLNIGCAIADITLGCAIYTLIQMLALGLLCAYLICWLYHKGISKSVCFFFILVFCFMRCFPQHAISMWKDPIFSAALMFYSLKLFDLVLSKGSIGNKVSLIVEILLSILVVCFTRNNGIYIIAFCLVLLLAIAYRQKLFARFRDILILHLACLLFVAVLTGPVFKHFGIENEAVETFGIPLQQIARTVTYDGDFTEDDLAFVNEILPLENWKADYTPSLVDPVKWDPSFNAAFFTENKGEFLAVWFRTLLCNPGRYVEAWILSTYGYWSPTSWELGGFKNNIMFGNPSALDTWYLPLDIDQQNLTRNDNLKTVFSLTTPTLYIGLLTWVIFFMVLYACWKGGPRFSILFAPAIGNLLTLMLAAPMAYWPRYSLVYLYMLPAILLFPQLTPSCEAETSSAGPRIGCSE